MLKEKLTQSPMMDFASSSRKALLSSAINQLAVRVTNNELPQAFRVAAADCLILLSGAKEFTPIVLNISNFYQVAKFAAEKGLANYQRLAVATSSAKSENVSIDAQLKNASPQAKKKILNGIENKLFDLDSAGLSTKELNVIFLKALDAITTIVNSGSLDQDLVDPICNSIETISTKKPSMEVLREIHNLVFNMYHKNSKEVKERVVDVTINVGQHERFADHTLEWFADKGAPVPEIVDKLKFLVGYFKTAQHNYNQMAISKAVKGVLPKLLPLLRNNFFAHTEVTVRKTVVQTMVQLYHFVGESEFEKCLSFFSLEQQKLIQVYIKKSLE